MYKYDNQSNVINNTNLSILKNIRTYYKTSLLYLFKLWTKLSIRII